jgi:hypothetical protein
MCDSIRLAFMASLILVVALTAALLQPDLAHDLGLELQGWTFPVNHERPDQTADAECARRLQAVDRRIKEKSRIAAELIDGQVTLFEAAAHFRRLDAAFPVLQPVRFGSSDDENECLCREVIAWVRQILSELYPGGVDELTAPFEDQLRRHKELHGTVQLADVGDR